MDMTIAKRGCGWPTAGDMYCSIPVSSNGIPIRKFLVDYPQPIPSEITIKKRGLTFVERDGVTHLADWIGKKFYPNFPDWWEEACMLGLHQKVEKNIDFSKLDFGRSKLLMVHPRGLLRSAKDIQDLLNNALMDNRMRYDDCPTDQHWTDWTLTTEPGGMCVGLLWRALIKGEQADGFEGELGLVKRSMPSFHYYGFAAQKNLKFQPAFLAAFPISMMNWVVYKGKNGEEEKALKRIEKAPDWVQASTQVMEVPNG